MKLGHEDVADRDAALGGTAKCHAFGLPGLEREKRGVEAVALQGLRAVDPPGGHLQRQMVRVVHFAVQPVPFRDVRELKNGAAGREGGREGGRKEGRKRKEGRGRKENDGWMEERKEGRWE